MPRKASLSIIAIVIILAGAMVALTYFGKFGTAQAQGNLTSLTPEQKAAICDPNNPLSKLNPVNTTESKICGIPKTVKPRMSNVTTGEEAPPTGEGAPPSASSIAPSANPPTGEEAPPTGEGAPPSASSIAPSAVPPP
jgi:cell division protein FtsN